MNPIAGLALRVLRDPKFRALLVSLGPAAATAATKMARQGKWRQLAIVHADTVVDGTFMRVPVDGEPHWIVWSRDEPVAAYPPRAGQLHDVVKAVDLSKRQRPDDLRIRSVRREAGERVRRARDHLPTRRPT